MIARAAAGLAAALAAAIALAQPAAVKPSPGDDLRSLYATSQDIAEGKRAAQECTRCHSESGISATPGVPSLAGQRAPYLHAQLRAYKSGQRAHSPVTGAVKFMSDDALMKVAAYYASLDPPKPAPPPRGAQGSRSDPVQVGRAVAQQCSGCHGDNGVSGMAGTPSLVALDPKYFVTAMNAYKGGARKNDLMKGIAAGLSEIDTNAAALHYALLRPAKAPNPAKGDAAAGKAAATSCAGCHGDNGNSTSPDTPSLAGQDAEYLYAATRAYKDGSRSEEAMKGIAAALDDKAMRDLAAYYAGQTPQQLAVRKPLGLAEWVDRCDRCHGRNGNSIDPVVPALASQRADWLEAALAAYRKGERRSTAMTAMTSQLSEADIKEIAAHYARQTARPVTYVIVPR